MSYEGKFFITHYTPMDRMSGVKRDDGISLMEFKGQKGVPDDKVYNSLDAMIVFEKAIKAAEMCNTGLNRYSFYIPELCDNLPNGVRTIPVSKVMSFIHANTHRISISVEKGKFNAPKMMFVGKQAIIKAADKSFF